MIISSHTLHFSRKSIDQRLPVVKALDKIPDPRDGASHPLRHVQNVEKVLQSRQKWSKTLQGYQKSLKGQAKNLIFSTGVSGTLTTAALVAAQACFLPAWPVLGSVILFRGGWDILKLRRLQHKVHHDPKWANMFERLGACEAATKRLKQAQRSRFSRLHSHLLRNPDLVKRYLAQGAARL